MSQIITIKIVSYSEEIQALEQIRRTVFREEQNITEELEFDGLDETSEHLLAYVHQEPIGTLRIREVDLKTVKIERLAVLSPFRNQSIGRQLMEYAIALITEKNQYEQIVIHAQYHLKSFYQDFDFQSVGETFEEAEILHIKMIKSLN
ncbi:MAG: GNAT family N-acetyltransferase [Snowella sp.]|jgi:predicted GNAT family N-acyltransferase|nr:MAG: GNAT family N-acetyltransferase [Snowella sp.]